VEAFNFAGEEGGLALGEVDIRLKIHRLSRQMNFSGRLIIMDEAVDRART